MLLDTFSRLSHLYSDLPELDPLGALRPVAGGTGLASRPPHLYHYTTTDGLRGILTSQSLYATDPLYLNDSTELSHGLDLLSEVYEQGRSAHEEWVADVLDECFPPHPWRFKRDPAYIACLSEAGDQLSQWRAYGRSGGAVIAFDVTILQAATGMFVDCLEMLRQLECEYPADYFSDDALSPWHPQALRENPRLVTPSDRGQRALASYASAKHVMQTHDAFRLVKVIYAPESQKELAARTIRVAEGIVRGDLSPDADSPRRAAAIRLISLLVRDCATCMKNNAFHEEQEWRLIFYPALPFGADSNWLRERLKFRAGGLGLTPFIEARPRAMAGSKTGRLPIDSIKVGPCARPDLAMAAASMLCLATDYNFVTVEKSSIPVRFF